jgi:transposase
VTEKKAKSLSENHCLKKADEVQAMDVWKKPKLGYRLPDELWGRLERLLPPMPVSGKGGRPRRPDRECADVIFFVLRTGCQWEALMRPGFARTAPRTTVLANGCRRGVRARL